MARDDNLALCKSDAHGCASVADAMEGKETTEPHDAASGLSTAARPGESLHKARIIGAAAALVPANETGKSPVTNVIMLFLIG